MTCLNMFPRYQLLDGSAGSFDSLQDAALAAGRVTISDYTPLDKPASQTMPEWVRHAQALREGSYARPTMFREIVAVPGPQPAWAEQAWSLTPGEREASIDHLADAGLEALRAAIADAVAPAVEHLMPHSAGYDSRLISMLLAERTRGGNARFVVWQPEVEETRAVLSAIGWSLSRLIEVGSGTVDYQAPALELLNLGAYQSEAERLIVGPSLAELALGGTVADKPTITATFSDETLGFNTQRWPSVAYFHAARLLDNPAPWRCARWIMPFVSEPWLRFVATYRVPGADQLKLAMLRKLSPAVADIPNPRFALAREIAKHGHHSYALLSDSTRAKVEQAYNGSWYGRHVAIGFDCPEAFGSHDHCIREYIKAAICEFLIVEGVEVCAS